MRCVWRQMLYPDGKQPAELFGHAEESCEYLCLSQPKFEVSDTLEVIIIIVVGLIICGVEPDNGMHCCLFIYFIGKSSSFVDIVYSSG